MGLFGKKEITIVDAWVIARTIAEDTIEILDIKRLPDLDDEFASGNIARLIKEPLWLGFHKKGLGKIKSREDVYRCLLDYYPKDYSDFSINSEQFEEIFIQSFHIVSSHFGYNTEQRRFKNEFLPFRKSGVFGSGASYFIDNIFKEPYQYQFSLEVCLLKSFVFRNYKKPIIGRELSLDQARSIAIMASSNVFSEIIKKGDEYSKIDSDQFEYETLAYCADEIAWQIYRNYYTHYRWTEIQTKELLNQTIHLISNYGEELLNHRDRFLDLNRAIYQGRAGYVHINSTPALDKIPSPGNHKKELIPFSEYLSFQSFKDKNYKSWKEPPLIKPKTSYGQWVIDGEFPFSSTRFPKSP